MKMGQMVYHVMMALVYVLVRTMLLVTNVLSVLLDIGTFLHVKVNKNIPTDTKIGTFFNTYTNKVSLNPIFKNEEHNQYFSL